MATIKPKKPGAATREPAKGREPQSAGRITRAWNNRNESRQTRTGNLNHNESRQTRSWNNHNARPATS